VQQSATVRVTYRLADGTRTSADNAAVHGRGCDRVVGATLKVTLEAAAPAVGLGDIAHVFPVPGGMAQLLHAVSTELLDGKYLNDDVAYFATRRCAPTLEHIAQCVWQAAQGVLAAQRPAGAVELRKVKVSDGTSAAKVKL
jgi:hypothetical protein